MGHFFFVSVFLPISDFLLLFYEEETFHLYKISFGCLLREHCALTFKFLNLSVKFQVWNEWKKPFHLTRTVSGISNRKCWLNEKRPGFWCQLPLSSPSVTDENTVDK